jgi:hypothetical protein
LRHGGIHVLEHDPDDLDRKPSSPDSDAALHSSKNEAIARHRGPVPQHAVTAS